MQTTSSGTQGTALMPVYYTPTACSSSWHVIPHQSQNRTFGMVSGHVIEAMLGKNYLCLCWTIANLLVLYYCMGMVNCKSKVITLRDVIYIVLMGHDEKIVASTTHPQYHLFSARLCLPWSLYDWDEISNMIKYNNRTYLSNAITFFKIS